MVNFVINAVMDGTLVLKTLGKMKVIMKLARGTELNLKSFCILLNITKTLDADIDPYLFSIHSKEFILQN